MPPYKILWGKSVDSVKEGGGGIRLIQGMKTHQQLASCREAWISAGPPFHKAAVSTRGVPSLLCLLLSPSVPCFDSFVPKQPHAGLRTQGTPSFCWPSLAYSLQSWVGACGPGLQTPPCSVPCFFLICCPRLRTQVGGGVILFLSQLGLFMSHSPWDLEWVFIPTGVHWWVQIIGFYSCVFQTLFFFF